MEFCIWVLKELEKGAIFVNFDKTYYCIGGHLYKKEKVSTWKGEPAVYLALSAPEVKFSFMFWGACCSDVLIPRPFFVWESKTDKEKKIAQADLNQCNKKGMAEIERKQAKALISNTPE